jgi:chorismate mutase
MSIQSEDSERLWAVRGAVQVERNARDAILASTTELMTELMARNDLGAERMVSCIFTCTDDLDAEFPAVAARELGLGGVPLLCNRELDVPGAMERVIRVLVHYYSDPNHGPQHVYLGAAHALRADLHSAQ